MQQIVACADDVTLLARSPKALNEIFHKLQNKSALVGLSINEDKTKYMQIKRTGIKDVMHLKNDNFAFENVENFNYLGSILNANNKMTTEIAERIVNGNKAYYANAKLIKSKFLKKNTKMKTTYAFLKGKYYERHLVLSILTIYVEYETTWRSIN